MKKVFIHHTALVDTGDIGAESVVWAYTHIMSGARIGKNCHISDHCFIESGVTVGDNTVIKSGNMLWEGITLEEGIFVGPCVLFTNDLYPRSRHLPETKNRYRNKKNWLAPTLIKRGASLGAGAVILPGVTVGTFSMVGAGAVVSRDVPPYGLVKGNPAKLSGWVCVCGLPIIFKNRTASCLACGLKFREDNADVSLIL